MADPVRARTIFLMLIDRLLQNRNEQVYDTAAANWIETWRKSMAQELTQHTAGYLWPGNLRECSSLIEEVFYQGLDAIPGLCKRLQCRPEPPFGKEPAGIWPGMTLREVLAEQERNCYSAVLVNARTLEEVSSRLGITRQTAARRLAHFGLALPKRIRARAINQAD